MAGKPLHDVEEMTSLQPAADAALEPVLADERHHILNDADFSEYRVFHLFLINSNSFILI